MWKQVGKMTLGGLLQLGYTVVMSYKRASLTFNFREVSLAFETIDSLGETFMVVRGTNRKVRSAFILDLYNMYIGFCLSVLSFLFIMWP